MLTYDLAKENLGRLIAGRSGLESVDINEAEVRFQIIDRILEEVLGWSRVNIHVEKYRDGDYTDYEVGKPARLLVEAKRSSKVFSIPSGYSRSVRVVPIATLCEYSEDTKDAIGQALRYCTKRGIQFGAIFNGTQFIAFVASRSDGIAPEDGNALVYMSLGEILDRFPQFWECFSSAGMETGYFVSLLCADALPPPVEKLSKQIVDYPGYKNRNPAATELQILGGLFLEDVVKTPEIEKEFLEKTYCSSGALSQYAMVSREILRARYASVFEQAGNVSVSAAVGKKGINTELYQDIVAANMGKRPILLVGDVGSGKSMFIRRLIKVDAVEQLEKAFVLYIDFGVKPALVDELRPYVVGEIERQMLSEYGVDVMDGKFVRSVYYVELQRFSRGIYGELRERDTAGYKERELLHLEQLMKNPEQHLRSSVAYASKNQKRPVIIFFDNVDQRPPAFQEQVFLIATAIAADWPVTTFVALRPETFLYSKTKGSLSGYQPRVFTIEPPRVDQVLAVRLAFARLQLERTARFSWMPKGFTLNSQTLLGYLQMLERGFSENRELIELLDNMSAGNLREALGMVTAFVGSAHVDSYKILEAIRKDGYYTLPLHEFVRAVIFGDHVYYAPNRSGIVNLYDVSSNDEKEHFLMAYILSYVEAHGQIGASDGFTWRTAIYRAGQDCGFQPVQVDAVLQRATNSRWPLLQTVANEPSDAAARFRITTAGAYTWKRLMMSFAYVDAMVVDTPIMDPALRGRILDADLLDERVVRMGHFLQYLDSCWCKMPKQSVFSWEPVSARLKDDLRKLAQIAGVSLG